MGRAGGFEEGREARVGRAGGLRRGGRLGWGGREV